MSETNYQNNQKFLAFLRQESGLNYFTIFYNVYDFNKHETIDGILNIIAFDVIRRRVTEEDFRELEVRYEQFKEDNYEESDENDSSSDSSSSSGSDSEEDEVEETEEETETQKDE